MLKKKEQVKSVKISKGSSQSQAEIERAELLEKIRIGLQQSKNGQVVSKEQVKKRLAKWFR